MLDEQQVSDGQNGTVPAIDSTAEDEASPQAAGDELKLPPEPEKPAAEKKKDWREQNSVVV